MKIIQMQYGTDVAALIATKGFDYLDAPVKILTPPNAPVAYAPILEDNYMISEEKSRML